MSSLNVRCRLIHSSDSVTWSGAKSDIYLATNHQNIFINLIFQENLLLNWIFQENLFEDFSWKILEIMVYFI